MKTSLLFFTLFAVLLAARASESDSLTPKVPVYSFSANVKPALVFMMGGQSLKPEYILSFRRMLSNNKVSLTLTCRLRPSLRDGSNSHDVLAQTPDMELRKVKSESEGALILPGLGLGFHFGKKKIRWVSGVFLNAGGKNYSRQYYVKWWSLKSGSDGSAYYEPDTIPAGSFETIDDKHRYVGFRPFFGFDVSLNKRLGFYLESGPDILLDVMTRNHALDGVLLTHWRRPRLELDYTLVSNLALVYRFGFR